MVIRGARRLWHSPLRWGVLYLALVPIFATVYASLPARSFHDLNIQLEAPLATDAAQLITDLSDAVGAQHRPPTWRTLSGSLELQPGTFGVTRIRYTQDARLLLELAGSYASVPGHEPMVLGSFGEWVEVYVEDRSVTEATGEAPQVGYAVALVNPNGGPAPISPLIRPCRCSCLRRALRATKRRTPDFSPCRLRPTTGSLGSIRRLKAIRPTRPVS